MPSTTGTLETLAMELGKLLKPLEQLLGPQIFLALGVELPRAIAGDTTLTNKLKAAAITAGQLDPKITALATAIGGNDTGTIISAGVVLTAKVAELVANLVQVGNALDQATNA